VYRAAIIGCGMIAGIYEEVTSSVTYSHGKAYFNQVQISELAFVDRDPEKAKRLAIKYEGSVCQGIQELLVEYCPDCISVCTTDDEHFPVLKEIMTNPGNVKVILVEKPVCSSSQELDELQVLATTSGVKVCVYHNRRFDIAHQSLKLLIQSQRLGKLLRGDADYYGGWCHIGVHLVDMFQYLFDTPLRPKKMSFAYPSKYIADPTLNVEAELKGVPLRFTGHDEAYYQIVDINLKFEKGQIRIEDFGQEIRVFEKFVNQENENVLAIVPELSGRGMVNSIINAVDTVIHYLKTGETACLAPFDLSQAELTMNTLWDGVKLYEDQSKK
jgi:predicted dehydrogenase